MIRRIEQLPTTADRPNTPVVIVDCGELTADDGDDGDDEADLENHDGDNGERNAAAASDAELKTAP